MGHNSLQVCMDSSSDWIQGSVHDDQSPMDSSSPLSGDILTCSRPLIERRLRPPHDQSLKCPRCDSTHTKFCYYNNYSLSQPRYFCKTCRRYWTKGGTLRNIPVGGGCRKNKKVSNSKKSNEDHNASMNPNHLGSSSSSSAHNPTDLQLSFPDHQMQFSHLNNLMLGGQGTGSNPSSFMDGRYGSINGLLENSNPLRPIDFMESKLEAIVGNARNYDFMGADNLGMVGGLGNMGGGHGLDTGYHGFCSSPFGSMSLDHHGNSNGSANFMDTCQRLMLPYETNEDHRHHNHHHHHQNEIHDVKPNTKLLSLEWQDQGCADAGKESSFAYLNGMGSWTGVMNNYGPSAANSLV